MSHLHWHGGWAIDRKLFWAFNLYYHLTTYWLPVLEAKLKDGHLAQDVTQQIRAYSSLFTILEGNVVNPNGQTFNQTFLSTVRAYQLSVVLPQYVDYLGDPDAYTWILDSVLTSFLEKHRSEPGIDQYMSDIAELKANRQLMQSFITIMRDSINLSGPGAAWEKIVTTFEVRCQKQLATVTNVLRKCNVVAALTAVAGFALVLHYDSFDVMTTMEKVQFIALSTGVFANILIFMARGIIRLKTLWTDFKGFWNGAKIFFGGDIKVEGRYIRVSDKLGSGFSRWFARSSREVMELQQENPGRFGRLAKMFGRNVTETLSSTLGAVLSIINIIVSAISISNATSPLEKAMHSLMIASGSLQLIAIVGNWVLAGLNVAGGVAANILSLCGALSVVAALAGIVIMIVLMCQKQDPPDPLKDFVNDEADKAGLRMTQGIEIDYFDVVQDNTGTSYSGISLKYADKYLRMNAMNAVPNLADLDHYPTTVFNLTTDENGQSNIFTTLTDDENRPITAYLGVDEAGNLMVLPPAEVPVKQEDGSYKPTMDEYQKALDRRLWNGRCQGNVNLFSGDKKQLRYANFTLESRGKPGQYLGIYSGRPGLGSDAQQATLSMEQIGPSSFSYTPKEWTLTTDARDERCRPVFEYTASQPLAWSIRPALDAAFELVTSGVNQGFIRQREGDIKPKQQSKTWYEVTVSSTINGHTYSKSAQVQIEVIAGKSVTIESEAGTPAYA